MNLSNWPKPPFYQTFFPALVKLFFLKVHLGNREIPLTTISHPQAPHYVLKGLFLGEPRAAAAVETNGPFSIEIGNLVDFKCDKWTAWNSIASDTDPQMDLEILFLEKKRIFGWCVESVILDRNFLTSFKQNLHAFRQLLMGLKMC